MGIPKELATIWIVELAGTMHDLAISGATRKLDRIDDWSLACEMGDDGIQDARDTLGDEICAAIYRAERVRLVT